LRQRVVGLFLAVLSLEDLWLGLNQLGANAEALGDALGASDRYRVAALVDDELGGVCTAHGFLVQQPLAVGWRHLLYVPR
jgi:hypothetical protein